MLIYVLKYVIKKLEQNFIKFKFKERKMEKKKLITPRKLQGFWELMPNEQILFDNMLESLKNVFKQNCFVPLDTPVLEYSEALLAKSGGDTDKEVYRFTKGDSDVCMRYDLTVPLARFVSMHQNELNFPFKRYQIGKVYRGERPQKGRFREFYQCDADIIGDGELPLIADAECISLFEKCFNALNFDVEIEISNRKILSGYIEEIGQTSNSSAILTVLDKLEKISENDAQNMLIEIGLNEQESEKITNLTKNCGNIEEILQNLRNFCKNQLFQTGLDELEETAKYLKLMGSNNTKINLMIIRGHDYYTGTVFEGFLKDSRIAVGGGGRFENLCGYFSDKNMPGVGMSVGITRLFDLMSKSGDEFNKENSTECAIVTFDETFNAGIELAEKLKAQGVRAESLYASKSFKSKMKEANRRQIKYVLIVGEEEITSKIFTLKNMFNGEQEKLDIEKIVEKIKSDRMQK